MMSANKNVLSPEMQAKRKAIWNGIKKIVKDPVEPVAVEATKEDKNADKKPEKTFSEEQQVVRKKIADNLNAAKEVKKEVSPAADAVLSQFPASSLAASTAFKLNPFATSKSVQMHAQAEIINLDRQNIVIHDEKALETAKRNLKSSCDVFTALAGSRKNLEDARKEVAASLAARYEFNADIREKAKEVQARLQSPIALTDLEIQKAANLDLQKQAELDRRFFSERLALGLGPWKSPAPVVKPAVPVAAAVTQTEESKAPRPA